MSGPGDDPAHPGSRSDAERSLGGLAWGVVLNGVLVAAFVVGAIPIVAIAHGFIELVQQSSLELPRLDLEFGPRSAIDDAYRYTGMTDAIAQL